MKQSSKRYYEFGPFRIDLKERVLERDGQIVPLTPKAFDTLLALVERRGELVDRNELIRTVWPDTHVVEGNLSSNIFMLRKALGEDSNGERYIATVPRRGYRFIARLREVADARDESNSPPGRRLAILPFKMFSVDQHRAYLGLGMADALITRLSNLTDLVVRPTSAVRKYMSMEQEPGTAGSELDVELILEGSIQIADERIRVRVQLVNIDRGAALWADKYDERLTDTFAVEDTISAHVAEALTTRVLARN